MVPELAPGLCGATVELVESLAEPAMVMMTRLSLLLISELSMLANRGLDGNKYNDESIQNI